MSGGVKYKVFELTMVMYMYIFIHITSITDIINSRTNLKTSSLLIRAG